jgi:hypothetical protein
MRKIVVAVVCFLLLKIEKRTHGEEGDGEKSGDW